MDANDTSIIAGNDNMVLLTIAVAKSNLIEFYIDFFPKHDGKCVCHICLWLDSMVPPHTGTAQDSKRPSSPLNRKWSSLSCRLNPRTLLPWQPTRQKEMGLAASPSWSLPLAQVRESVSSHTSLPQSFLNAVHFMLSNALKRHPLEIKGSQPSPPPMAIKVWMRLITPQMWQQL